MAVTVLPPIVELPPGSQPSSISKGDQGVAATIAIGTVSTLSAGSPATVTNAGTANSAVLNFGIPKGADGAGGSPIANNTVLGNVSGISALPVALTATQVKTLLAIAAGDVSGLGYFATGTDAANLTGTLNNLRLSAVPNSALANSSITLNTHSVSLGGSLSLTASDIGLGSVTNDAQTKAAIVPNTAPTAGQLHVGNAGGTAFGVVSLSGDASLASTGALTIANNAVSYAKFQQVAAVSIVGNPTGSLANAQGITLGSTLAFSGTALQTAALTGDVTASANSFATTIASGAVSLAKMANLAANSIIGNNTGSPATPIALTQAQATAMLNALVGDSGSGGTKGLAPAPASGDAAAGKFLKADGTWAVPAGGSGLTNFSSDGTTLSGSGQTVTTSKPILDLTQTWNAGAVAFTGLRFNFTDTASSSSSWLADLQVSSSSKLRIDKTGSIYFYNFTTGGSIRTDSNNFGIVLAGGGNPEAWVSSSNLRLGATYGLAWSATTNNAVAAADLFLFRDAAGTLAQRNSTNAQKHSIYNTYTDASNYERGGFDWSTTSNVLRIRSENAGTGTSRLIAFDVWQKAGAPTTGDIPSGTAAIVRDTSGATTKLYYNNAGTLMSVALT